MMGSASEPLTVSLRRGTAADLDRVIAIMDSAFDPAFGEAWTRAQCAGILPLTGVGLTIAENDEPEILGFSLSRTIGDESELLLLAVSAARRRQGIGNILLDRFLQAARAAGAKQAHLEVRENNHARAMYESAGFVSVGRRKNYYSGDDGKTFDALTFVRRLDNISDGL